LRFWHHFAVQLFSQIIPVVFASLQPPATICQPSGLMQTATIRLLHFNLNLRMTNEKCQMTNGKFPLLPARERSRRLFARFVLELTPVALSLTLSSKQKAAWKYSSSPQLPQNHRSENRRCTQEPRSSSRHNCRHKCLARTTRSSHGTRHHARI